MIRDLIELANKDEEQAAFIFLDQEKAYNRVNHDFLYKTMRAFGIGEEFIEWVRTIYSNGTAVLNINGYLSNEIPLNRGVRQGCPLSALLYILVIEVLAIQLRLNPNIIGFKIGGEKIVSTHYSDDATIIIKQNRCFKEVIKELKEYEDASGAKINYDKTNGLWTGSWKDRRVSPMNIKWTNKNVEKLGVFFGNKEPEVDTYNKIIPSLIKRLNYWKQFKLTQIGKARVVEMFLASKLIYATKFYPIPLNVQTTMQKAIFDFINFPNVHNVTIAQAEMRKTKMRGGIKLITIQHKSETSKAKWLIDIATNENLKLNLDIFTSLIGQQKGNIDGRDLIFVENSYIKNNLKVNHKFYREALLTLTRLETKKGIKNLQDWDKEHLFYNPLFTTKNGKSLVLTNYCKKRGIYKYEQLIDEKRKEMAKLPYDKILTNLLDRILIDTTVRKDDILVKQNEEEVKMPNVTQKIIYEETLLKIDRDHHSQVKWVDELDVFINWNDVWKAVHNILSTNETKNTIWEQIHLNFYTQYSYNKWHKKKENCPLCQKIPKNIYHIILYCDFTNKLWEEIQPLLRELHPRVVEEEEKAFGITQNNQTTGILLRNWLTYLLRHCIQQTERAAYKADKNVNFRRIVKTKFINAVRTEIRIKAIRYKNEGKLDYFDKIITREKVKMGSI